MFSLDLGDWGDQEIFQACTTITILGVWDHDIGCYRYGPYRSMYTLAYCSQQCGVGLARGVLKQGYSPDTRLGPGFLGFSENYIYIHILVYIYV